MTLHPIKPDTRQEVWLSGGLTRQYRVTSHTHDYGEWDREMDARLFLQLLIEGNPDRLKAKT